VLGGNGGQGEVLVLSISAGAATALLLASIDRFLPRPVLSRLAVRVTLMLIPPPILIFLVLGTIFLGVATPTEGGAMGAVGALVLAVVRRRLDFPLLRQAVDYTAQLTCFVVFILIGATVFSFAFNAADGHIWVEHLFNRLPGGETGFLVAVMALVFVLGCFLDFFEIAFIVLPLLLPTAQALGIDLVWFGGMICANMQTSFMHPPFGFALFYLRGIVPREKVRTRDIYLGAIPWLVLQLILVGILIAFPELVTFFLDKTPEVDLTTVEIVLPPAGGGATPAAPTFEAPPPPSFGAPSPTFETPPAPSFN